MNAFPAQLRKSLTLASAAATVLISSALLPARAAGPMPAPAFRVLAPIVHGNLALYPVVPSRSYDTSHLLTLDEGTRSGQVTISENGVQPAMMHPGQRPVT